MYLTSSLPHELQLDGTGHWLVVPSARASPAGAWQRGQRSAEKMGALQSESPHVSSAVTTIVLVPDLRQRSCSFSVPRSGNTATMLCVMTQLSGSVLLHAAN